MDKRSFTFGIFVGAGIIVALLVLVYFAFPHLYLATENNNFAELRKKSELDCQTMPLHCFVRDGEAEKISEYVTDGGNLELKDNWGRTALYWSISKHKPKIATLLLSLGADSNTRDENGRTIFYQSVAWEKYDIADALIANGADINAYSDDRYPETALHYCVMKDKYECVRYLLDKGADISLKDSFGYTVFDRARIHEHISSEVANLLKNNP